MQFSKLVVESFKAVQRADIEFGAGLNVLYGPNDLGKSTLAAAIRAALLVPPNSSEAEDYAPWQADERPSVSLTFVGDDGSHWKVKKTFGDGANTGAMLQHSKDGTSFTLDCKGRQVEEKLRALLAWGIPAPGGKGGPRGLPTSFLANVLLAAQTDVDTILEKSLEGDGDDSGKLRLTKALATLAEDPMFKRVLDAAQREVDLCFTSTGKRKRGQASKFTDAGNAVRKLQEELNELEKRLGESSAIEESVNDLRERQTHARVQVAEAGDALAVARRRLENARAREQAKTRLTDAQAALARINEHAARVRTLASEMETLAGRVKAREGDVARAAAKHEEAAKALRAAEEAHRIATSEDGARQRQLRLAQLEKEAALLVQKRQVAERRRADAEAAVKARSDAETARRAVQTARAERDKIRGALTRSRQRVQEAEAELEIARATLAYGRWQSAASAAEDAARATEIAGKQRAEAGAKDLEAASLEKRARAIEEGLSARQALLPAPEEAKVLERLERDLEVAEAALGGGLSVAVRPRAGVAIRAVVDQKQALDERSLSKELVLEAERNVLLSVGEVLDLEITAGAADKRQAVKKLRRRWETEGVPVLERAGVKSLADLLKEMAAAAQERASALDLRQSAERLRAEAKNLRENAGVNEERAAKLAADIDLEARKAAIGATDLRTIEARFAKLGKLWESKAEDLHRARTEEAKAAQAQVAATEKSAAVAEHSLTEAEQRAGERCSASERTLASLGSGDPEGLFQALGEEIASHLQSEAENDANMKSLAEEASGAVEKAAAAVRNAGEGLRSAKEDHDRALSALDSTRQEFHAGKGQLAALGSQLEAMDRHGAEGLVSQRQRELSALPQDSASEADVQMAQGKLDAAQRALAEANEELHKSEGALSKVGGAALREEVERVKEALQTARNRERDLEIDADAWKLLLETLRAVENEEGAHLGRALGGALTAKFVELTGGRYDGLRLDPMLKTEGVDVPSLESHPDVLEALSVGTRDQLATLIRLAIAEQLESAILLDDHLVHTDPTRLVWFRDVLMKTAVNTQVIVLTCRPEDYLSKDELPAEAPVRDLAGGGVRAIDLARVMKRWGR